MGVVGVGVAVAAMAAVRGLWKLWVASVVVIAVIAAVVVVAVWHGGAVIGDACGGAVAAALMVGDVPLIRLLLLRP